MPDVAQYELYKSIGKMAWIQVEPYLSSCVWAFWTVAWAVVARTGWVCYREYLAAKAAGHLDG